MKDEKDEVRSMDVRHLRRTVNQLADAVDELVAELEEQTPGQGPPEQAQAARERAKQVRDSTPVVSERARVTPPWEREGYESKQAWLDDQE
jgi:hypothetical protein